MKKNTSNTWMKTFEFQIRFHSDMIFWPHWLWLSTSSDNVLTPGMRQDISGTNYDPVRRRIYMSPGPSLIIWFSCFYIQDQTYLCTIYSYQGIFGWIYSNILPVGTDRFRRHLSWFGYYRRTIIRLLHLKWRHPDGYGWNITTHW